MGVVRRRRLWRRLRGREDDVFSFPAVGGGGRVLVFPDMVERCFLYVSGVSEFRVERHAVDRRASCRERV